MGMEMDEGGFEVCGLGWFWSEEVSGFWVSVGRGCFGGERRDKGERERAGSRQSGDREW